VVTTGEVTEEVTVVMSVVVKAEGASVVTATTADPDTTEVETADMTEEAVADTKDAMTEAADMTEDTTATDGTSDHVRTHHAQTHHARTRREKMHHEKNGHVTMQHQFEVFITFRKKLELWFFNDGF